jgi:predicted PurR-regulated permease PerM
MAATPTASAPNRFIVLATFCLIVTALYFAQDVLVPLALAVLFSFLLTPLVIRLERLGIPRAVASTGSVLLGLCLIVLLGWILSSQAVDLAGQLPKYQENISAKISHLPFLRNDGAFKKLSTEAHELKTELSPTTAQSQAQPMTVTVTDQSPWGMTQLRSLLSAIVSPLATTFIVAVFVIFMLIRREDLRDRVIRLVGEGQLDITTKALSEAGDRISRYLLMQTAVNTAYGLVIGTGLWTIGRVSGQPGGFPDAPLWGLLCGLFRFIPYVGPWIGAFFPVVLSIAVFPGAREFIATISLFVCVEVLNNSAIEPLLYGSSTGLSAVAILAAAVFWSWLWGPIGLLLSTPLTACIVVIGKYVPQMKFFDILLGDEPPLPPATRLYQRLLALDAEAASEVIDEYRKAMALEELYDTVIIPALAMAEKDHHSNQLDAPRRATMRQSLRDVLDDLGERERKVIINSQAKAVEHAARTDTPDPKAPALVDILPVRPRLPEGCTVTVLCLPAHDESDELVAVMITQLLEFRGYCASSMGQSALASEMLDQVEHKSADLIVVSALPPTAITHARYLCKRLEARFPSIPIVIGLWIYDGDRGRAKERVSSSDHAQVTTSLEDALGQINQIAQQALLNNKAEAVTSVQ